MSPKLSSVLTFVTAWTLLPINLHTQVYSLELRPHIGCNNFVRLHRPEIVQQYNQLHNSAASFPPNLRTSITLSAATLNNANDGYEAPVKNVQGANVSFIPDYSLDGDFADQNPLEEFSLTEEDVINVPRVDISNQENFDMKKSKLEELSETKIEDSQLRSEYSSPPEELSTALMISDFHVTIREDKKDQIRHMEFYLKKERGGEYSLLLI